MGEKIRIQELDPSAQELMGIFTNGFNLKYGRYGDIGCLLAMNYKEDADNFRNMALRSDDIWLVTFPSSGTTWTQELVWLLKNQLNFDMASKIPLMRRYMFLEFKYTIFQLRMTETRESMELELYEEISKTKPSYGEITTAPSPRFLKTHLPLSLLPLNLLDNAKVVYVARDPRDVAVSFYYHNVLFNHYSGDFRSFWNLFIKGLVPWAPFFSHVKEAWAKRHHPNMFFIFYEDMKKDLPSSIKRIANFFDKEITNDQIVKLCDHLDIKNFRENKSVNESWIAKIGPPNSEGFVRQGKSGGWHEHFDTEMKEQAEKWMLENRAGSDLRFPHDNS